MPMLKNHLRKMIDATMKTKDDLKKLDTLKEDVQKTTGKEETFRSRISRKKL